MLEINVRLNKAILSTSALLGVVLEAPAWDASSRRLIPVPGGHSGTFGRSWCLWVTVPCCLPL